MRHVLIVGGGASGLVAAISAAREGARVTLLEQKDRVGKKILSTGNGRCNLTNTYMSIDCFRGDDISIVTEVLQQFSYKETMKFFQELGVILKERQGYIYPLSDQASTILDVLRLELKRQRVTVVTECHVKEVVKNKKGFTIKTTQTTYTADAVILATGGKAAPTLGSDGSGYAIAKSFGHHMSPVVPALVQLKGQGHNFKQVAGVRTQAKVSVYVNDQVLASDTGELQLTAYGLSGIPIFQISRFAAKGLYAKKSVTVEIDFMPQMTIDELINYLKNRRIEHGFKLTEDFLIGMFHKKLGNFLLKEAHISVERIAEQLTDAEIIAFCQLCKRFRVDLEDTNGFEQAQICAGGIKTTEIHPHSMESLFEKGFYLTGELLDIDGICGGYNLQWAWATGYLAGTHAAKG